MFGFFRSIFPSQIKRPLRTVHRQILLLRAIRRAQQLPMGSALPDSIAADLIYGWANQGMSANKALLCEVYARALQTNGSILECGSGLSTIVLGLAAQRSGSRVWTLEHDRVWEGKIRRALNRYRIRSVEILAQSLRNYGNYVWYAQPERLPRNVSLVVCDGPPGSIHGGRYGLLPHMRDHFASTCLILLDDVHRPGERAILDQWVNALHARFEIASSPDTPKQFARIFIDADNVAHQ